MLKTTHLDQMVANCNYPFARRQLIINNVRDEERVQSLAAQKVRARVVDDVFCVSEYAQRALNEYCITDGFAGGYNYSIAEIVGIYCCTTKYLLHFSSDSYIPKEFCNSDWIRRAIAIMEERPDIVVANPTWNYEWENAKAESDNEMDGFYVGYGFSDQCYLINTEVFKGNIYNYHHRESLRYPEYGGELFEKRIDSFMRCNGLHRITAKDVSYISRNITFVQKCLETWGIRTL